jgi:drug/metabolite transporter (DMT)-like permease
MSNGPGSNGLGEAARNIVPLAIKGFALIAIYAAYGLLQERIIKGHYPSNNAATSDTFRSAPLLVLCNRLTSLASGLVLALLQPSNARYSLPLQAKQDSRRHHKIIARFSALLNSIRPASPLFYYALVAGLNNGATLSQYASLSYLSFTTSTLGKTAKMVPVLIIGHLWFGKRYKRHQWIGALVVIVGIWTYLTSLPRVEKSEAEEKRAIITNWIGVLCLLAYLFFDGLTSTVQERLFNLRDAKVADEPSVIMGITSGIIDQMVHYVLFISFSS